MSELDLCSGSAYFQVRRGIFLLGRAVQAPGRSILPMSAESSNDDQAAGGSPNPVGGAAPAGPAAHADPWSVPWASDALRQVRSIGVFSSFASLGPRLRSRRPVVIAGIAVVGLLGGAGAALETTESGVPAVQPSAVAARPAPAPVPTLRPGRLSPPFGRHFAGGGLGGPAGLVGALHGQIVVAKPGGGYQTIDIQNGQVTAVSTTSITLRSADGYSRAYAITNSTIVDAQRDGISSIKVGNQVSLSATVTGSTATAIRIRDVTLLQQDRAALGLGRMPGPAGPALR
jgi:hypothetical protein